MSEPSQNDPSQLAKKRLAQACRTKDTSMRLAWAITIGEAVLLGVLTVALMDYWLMLPVWIRSVGATVVGALALFGIYRLVSFWRRPTKLKEAALDMEAQRPDLGCEISTAAEYLSGERQTTKEYEPELVAALEAKAAEELGSAQIPYERRLLRPGIILFVTLLVLLVFVVMAPVAFTALTRAALPFSKARYTQVLVKPGSVEIPVGRDLEITNVFSGRLPKDPQIQWRQETETQWQTAPLTRRSSDGAYLYSLTNLRSDLRYRVLGNDAVSESYEIKTYVPPEVKDLALRVDYPKYTHLKSVEQKSPDITALRASSVELKIEPSTKLSQATLRFSGSTNELRLQPNEQGLWTGNLKIAKDADYWIELADLKGHRGGDQKPHHIKAIPDTPPKVEIAAPAQDTHASATNKVPVKVSAADDFAVEGIQIVFHKLGGADHVVPAKLERKDNGEVTATAELDLSPLKLKDFELVSYHAEAKDNNTLDGPGVGKSPVYFVEITNLPGESDSKKPPGPQAQQVNLLDIEKQIIADTTALASNAPVEKFNELGTRQHDAQDFGQIYLDKLTGAAPPGAVTEMQAAVKEMESASGYLGSQKRGEALPPEESALAHLYLVLKQLPELENMPTQPKPQDQKLAPTNQLAVVLKALKEKKKEQPDDKAIEEARQEAENLASEQAALNTVMRNPDQSAAQGQGKGQGQKAAQTSKQNQKGSQAPKASGDKGKGQPGEAQMAKSKPADAQPNDSAQAKDESPSQDENPAEKEAKVPQLAKAQQAGDQAKGESDAKEPGQGKGEGKSEQLAEADQKQGKGKGQGQGEGEGKGKGQAQKEAKGKGKGQGQGQGRGQGQGQGEGDGQGEQSPTDPQTPDPAPPQDPAQIAAQEQQLSKEAQDLAEKLERLAGKDKRLGHNAGQNAKLGGQKIATASDEIKKGNFGAAGVNGLQGELALRKVAAQLEHILRDQPELTDVASEDAPKKYESLISEYFKRLSHAE